jgi:hypothetical protein
MVFTLLCIVNFVDIVTKELINSLKSYRREKNSAIPELRQEIQQGNIYGYCNYNIYLQLSIKCWMKNSSCKGKGGETY